MRVSTATRLQGGRLALVLALLAVVLGWIGTAVAAFVVFTSGERGAAAGADRYAERAAEAVTSELQRYEDTVAAAAASLSAQENLTAGDFATVTEPLRQARLAGASGIVFVVPVDEASRTSTVQRFWRGQGVPALTLRPAAGVAAHRFTVFYRTLDDRLVVEGQDLAQSPELADVMTAARRGGGVAISKTYVLLKDRQLPSSQQQLGFAMAAPVTMPAGASDTVAGATGWRVRGAAPLRGWIILGLRGDDLLRETLQGATEGRANVWLTTVSAEGADTGTGRDAAATTVASLINGREATERELRTGTVRVANDRWFLRTQSTAVAAREDAGTDHLVPIILGGGASLTVLLAVLFYLLMTSRDRAVVAVLDATAELREAESQARASALTAQAAERHAARQAGLLAAVMDSISDGVGVVDETGAFLLHNPAARTLLGMVEDLDDPRGWQEHYGIYRPDGVTPFPTDELPLVHALNGRSRDHVEMVIRPRGASHGVPISVSAGPLDGSAGIVGAVAVFHDISARLATEAELRAAEERFRFAFDHAHVGMAVTGVGEAGAAGEIEAEGAEGERVRPGQFLLVNEALSAMLGYTAEDLRSRTFIDVTHPEDRDAAASLLSAEAWAAAPDGEGSEGTGDERGDRAGATSQALTRRLEKRYLKADGRTIWTLVNSTLVRDAQGQARYTIMQIEDITTRRAETARLSAMALQDPLTGLGNRTLIRDRLAQAVARTSRTGQTLAVFFCDLDDFKPVNDTYGHAVGDEVLRQIAYRLRQTVRPTDTVARVGGDEFVILCEELESASAVHPIIGRLTAALDQPIVVRASRQDAGEGDADGDADGDAGAQDVASRAATAGAAATARGAGSELSISVHASIGVATAAGPGADVDDVLGQADAAMYTLKRARHNVRTTTR